MNIVSALKSRLPGGTLYNDLVKWSKCRTSKDNPFETALVTKSKEYASKMFWKTGKNKCYWESVYIKDIYDIMCDLFTYTAQQNCFDFNGIKIPKPISDKDICLFVDEARDLLFPHITNNREFCELYYVEGPYESDSIRILPDDVVIDCGANIGLFSAAASYKGATVYAFEPSDATIDSYTSKTAKFNPNIHICKYALFNKCGVMEFTCDDDENIGASHLSSLNTDKTAQSQIQMVQAITLDEFVNDNNISKVDFIKADIEGAERYMLEGAKQVLKEFAPKLSICTYHLPDDPEVLRKIIIEANSDYTIEKGRYKMYAYCLKR